MMIKEKLILGNIIVIFLFFSCKDSTQNPFKGSWEYIGKFSFQDFKEFRKVNLNRKYDTLLSLTPLSLTPEEFERRYGPLNGEKPQEIKRKNITLRLSNNNSGEYLINGVKTELKYEYSKNKIILSYYDRTKSSFIETKTFNYLFSDDKYYIALYNDVRKKMDVYLYSANNGNN